MYQQEARLYHNSAGCNPMHWKSMETSNWQNYSQLFPLAEILSAPGVAICEKADAVVGGIAAAAADGDDKDDDLPLSEWVRKIGCEVLGHYDYDT